MKPIFSGEGHIVADCTDCGARTTFEFRDTKDSFGIVQQNNPHYFRDGYYPTTVYMLVRCAGCGRGGMVEIHCSGNIQNGIIGDFYPISVVNLNLPENTPANLIAEFREAEKCICVNAWRAASALLRSTLEKTLVENGYTDQALQSAGKRKNLKERIELAGDDGVITSARRQRAQEDVRVLGNDVLHDEWREVAEEEVLLSHHYVQRILEDFYDDRPTVESVLVSKGRIIPTSTPTVS